MNFNLIRPFLATELGIEYEITYPLLFLVMIPALVLAIIPFFRLHKSRRYNVKHIVPLFIHIFILAIACTLITQIKIIETTTAPEDTQIIVVADMSDSNSSMKDKMNAYIKDLQESADESTEIGVVVFANDHIYFTEFGEVVEDYLDVSGSDVKSSNTNIQGAIEYASTLFSQTSRVNKRVLLMSDGRQTLGNAWSAAKKLSLDDIRLDGAYFDVVDDENTAEVQMVSMSTKVVEERDSNVSISMALKSTKATSGKITFYEIPQGTDGSGEPFEVYSQNVSIKKGNNSFSFKYLAEEAGIHSVYAVFEVNENEQYTDAIAQNNTLYSWFSIDSVANILLVDGDGTQVSSKITNLLTDYQYTVIETTEFPDSMEELLPYDEIVMMNIDFSEMPAGSTDLVKRYVEELGRGLVFTCGSNTYNYNNQDYADNPLIDILPVDLKIDERREVIATIITVDMSSSMGQAVTGTSEKNEHNGTLTRYDMVKQSVIKVLDSDGFEAEDYIGIVLFDSDASIALPLTQLHEKDWIIDQINYSFESYFYKHSDEKNPSFSNRLTGGTADANGYSIKSYGTNYKFGIDLANKMLSESDADLKQMVFLSDGEPSDKNSGYDNTIRRMANAGVVTSTISVGKDTSGQANELATLATIGHGKFSQVTSTLDLNNSLVQIAESIKGKPINEKVTELEKRNDSAVLVGVPNEFDKINGYYGTTIKDGAKIIISADDLRPIIAEWEIGLGHSTVYMSDLGGSWSKPLFTDADEVDNLRLVQNILVNSINDKIGSSGLIISSERNEDITKLTVETEKRIRDNEQIVAFVTDAEGNTIEYTDFVRVADTKYRKEITTDNQEGTYHIEVKLVGTEDAQLYDRAEYAVVGFYASEYDLFNIDGESVMEDLATAGDGEVMADAEKFYDIKREEFVQYQHDISTPALIVLLLLFIIDLLFRHFSPKKKEKKNVMTEEERFASMRGR